jgi:hypothetical protein
MTNQRGLLTHRAARVAEGRCTVEARCAVGAELLDRAPRENGVGRERLDEVLWAADLLRFGAQPEQERVYPVVGIVARDLREVCRERIVPAHHDGESRAQPGIV